MGTTKSGAHRTRCGVLTATSRPTAAAAGKVQTRTTGRSLGLSLTAATAADQIIQFVRA